MVFWIFQAGTGREKGTCLRHERTRNVTRNVNEIQTILQKEKTIKRCKKGVSALQSLEDCDGDVVGCFGLPDKAVELGKQVFADLFSRKTPELRQQI